MMKSGRGASICGGALHCFSERWFGKIKKWKEIWMTSSVNSTPYHQLPALGYPFPIIVQSYRIFSFSPLINRTAMHSHDRYISDYQRGLDPLGCGSWHLQAAAPLGRITRKITLSAPFGASGRGMLWVLCVASHHTAIGRLPDLFHCALVERLFWP